MTTTASAVVSTALSTLSRQSGDKLGGPDALSPLEVVRLAEQAGGKTIVVQHVPEEALRAQLGAATDSLQQSFAGLMLYHAGGDVIDMTETLRALPVRHLKSVREYLQTTVSNVGRASNT